MELWELAARESIRDLVARYNANGDAGRFDQVVELFAPDAVMEIGDGLPPRVGREQIRTIFTSVRDGVRYEDRPVYLRHNTSTLQIDLADEDSAKSRCYYVVITDVGLDHWGRYVDEFKKVDGVWRFVTRRVTIDGKSPDSLFVPDPG
ncbi:MAG: nuclear transport factor 2 family protein [Acidimicrobiales bacterium]